MNRIGQNISDFIFRDNVPRWVVFVIDMLFCGFSLMLAYYLRFNFSAIPQHEIDRFPILFPFILGVRAFSFFYTKSYKGIIRYTSSKDAQRMFLIITAGTAFISLSNLINFYLIQGVFLAPFPIVVIEYLATTFLIISYRMMAKAFYFEYKNPSRGKRNVIIYGAGEAGIISKRTLDRDAGNKYKVLAFIDDNEKKSGKKLEGVSIMSINKLDVLLKDNDVAHLIISIQNLSPQKKQSVVDICLNHNTKVLNVPPANSWINGELSFKQIKKIKIEDLLERDPIQLNEHNIQEQVNGKVILVTGAAGSIGSEIVRQLCKFDPEKIILFDQAESPLYEVETEITALLAKDKFEIVIGDIRNQERMQRLFDAFHPKIVFHAAAYKHVPMMEQNPSEAILTNIFGTKILADLAHQFNTEKFVLISTDKAVNPSSVMGASKRVAEIYVQSLNKESKTSFITTRFGNVLGSNGSVIPRFRQQIENGGPVTITDPEITRFFMTIPEACQLVLEAGAMGKGGEIYLFDMGTSVKILDLAKKMIQLSGLTLGKDIQITYTGLRPGEKLYEELLNDQENTLPTHHQQIMIAKVKEYEFKEVSEEVQKLIALFKSQDNKSIVQKMKELVPEFISNNSVYEELDLIEKDGRI